MKRRIGPGVAWLALIVAGGFAAERSCRLARGPTSGRRGRGWCSGYSQVRTARDRCTPPATTLVRIYVIETDEWRFELTDVAPASSRTVDAVVGEAVTFAVDKKTLYVRDRNGLEHRLRVTKKLTKSRLE